MVYGKCMRNQPWLKMFVATVAEATLKEINFPVLYEVIEYSDSFFTSGHAQQLNASFSKGLADEGTMKLQSSSRTKSASLVFFLPSQLMHAAHFLEKFLGAGKLSSHFDPDLPKLRVPLQTSAQLFASVRG